MKVYFHNRHIEVTKDSYAYVYEYKQQLMSNLARFLRDSNIKYVISHGNLIEYERKRPIFHDDDIDIRMDNSDISNIDFSILKNYNLKLIEGWVAGFKTKSECNRHYYWHHINLLVFESDIPVVNMTIFADLVCNKTNISPWVPYDLDYTSLREITYMGTKTFAPSEKDTIRLLEKEYGKNWIIPNYNEYSLV
jgi:hypothetical protein